MNILVVFTYGVSLKLWHDQGLISREFALYKKLLEENPNLNFTFLTFGNNEDLEIQHIQNLNNFNIIPIYKYINFSEAKIINILKTIIFALRFRKYNTNNFKIVKTNQLNGAWIAFVISRVLKSKLFIRTGFSPYLFAKYNKQKFYKILFFKYLTKLSVKYSHLYTVSSKNEKLELIDNLNLNSSKIKVRSNWILHTKYKDLNNRLDKVVLGVGRLEEQKNYFSIIEHLANSDIGFHVVGDGSLKSKLSDFSEVKNVKMEFLGSLDNKDLQQLYKKYKYYVIFSKYEGNSKSIKEALSAGCIVIANNLPSSEEIIQKDENGILINIEKENLVDVINKLNGNKSIAKKLSYNAHKSAEQYSLNNYVTKELSDYFQVLK